MSGNLSAIGTKLLDLMSGLYEAAEIVTHGMHGHGAPTTIIWAPPAAVEWVPGGFELTSAQLNATTDRGPLPLTYDPPLKKRLDVGEHMLSVSLDSQDFEALPEMVTLTVKKAKVTIAWTAPQPMDWVSGGAKPDSTRLNATTTPFAAPLAYKPDTSGGLPPGKHQVTAFIPQGEPYEADPVTVEVVVNDVTPAASAVSAPATVEPTSPPTVTIHVPSSLPPDPDSAAASPASSTGSEPPISSGDALKRVQAAIQKAEVKAWQAAIIKDPGAAGQLSALGKIVTTKPFPVEQLTAALDLVGDLEAFMNRVYADQEIFRRDTSGVLDTVQADITKVRFRNVGGPFEQRRLRLHERFVEYQFMPPQDFAVAATRALTDDLKTLADEVAARLVHETAYVREGLIHTADYNQLEGEDAVRVIARLGGGRSSPNSPDLYHLHVDGRGTSNLVYQDTGTGPVKVLGMINFHMDSKSMKNDSNKNAVAKVEGRAGGGGFTTVLVDTSTNEIQRD